MWLDSSWPRLLCTVWIFSDSISFETIRCSFKNEYVAKSTWNVFVHLLSHISHLTEIIDSFVFGSCQTHLHMQVFDASWLNFLVDVFDVHGLIEEALKLSNATCTTKTWFSRTGFWSYELCTKLLYNKACYGRILGGMKLYFPFLVARVCRAV